MPTKKTDKFITAQEAAERASVALRTVYGWLRNTPALGIQARDRTWKIKVDILDQLIASETQIVRMPVKRTITKAKATARRNASNFVKLAASPGFRDAEYQSEADDDQFASADYHFLGGSLLSQTGGLNG
ncbi:MAG TPA: hypothetical protein VMF62_12275 [Acetobacteraceae bacterium]|nr:hypothetical protein [Acetobacteraceae bacterium]